MSSYHVEGSARIHVPQAAANQTKEAFVNPVQHYNRDTSIAVIRTWSQLYAQEKQQRWDQKRQNKRRKLEAGQAQDAANDSVTHTPYKFTVFEGLAATGLRSIRYAKEIPLLRLASSSVAREDSRPATEPSSQTISALLPSKA
jgi:tRNA (guanine26-N2/guanine27-N2)-dimethyltransferase